MPRVRMESIIGFLVYLSRTYRYMNSYLKEVRMTLGSWGPYRDEEVWRLRGEELRMAEVEVKCKGLEEVYKPILVMAVP